MLYATSPASFDEPRQEDVASKFRIDPLREALASETFAQLLQDIWEPPTCFEAPAGNPGLGLGLRQGGESLVDLLDELREKVVRHAVHTRHVWALAHMTPPPATASVLADFLVGALNQCAFIWEEAPLAQALEAETVAWLARRLRWSDQASGLLTAGGTLSNCMAAYLALAHSRKRLGKAEGFAVIASDQAHLSVRKAAAFIGAGADAVVCARTDAEGRLIPGQVAAAAAQARRMGRRPFLFVCTAGTSNTGVLEPPEEFLEQALAHQAWCHIDASHGGLVALGSRPHPALAAWAEADSISWDPHKSLYVSFAVGALLLRDASLQEPLKFHAEYALKHDESVADPGSWHLEGSRRLEALKLWMVIRHLGDEGLDELTDHSLALAGALADCIRRTPDFRLVTSPDTNIVCFRFDDPALDAAALDAVNAKVQQILYRSGGPLISSTRVGGRVVLRTVLLNPHLETRHLPEILQIVRDEARRQTDALLGRMPKRLAHCERSPRP